MSDIAAPNLSGQSSAFPVSNHRVGRSAFSRLELGLRDASTQQDELSEARQQVLIDRQRVASSARQIRELRNGIAGKEARIMDIFRKYYTDLGERMPDDLILAYSDVENSRNDLIIAEDVHNDKEQDLELSEMTLTDQEADLYQLKLPQLLQVENTDTFEASVNLGSLPLSCSPSEVTQRAAALDREALVHGSYNPKRRVSYSLADYNPLRRNGSPEAEYVSSRAQYFNEEVDHMFRRELQAQNTQVVSSTLRNSALINGREPCEIVRASPFIHHVAEAPSHRPKTVFIEKTWSAKDDPDLELPIDDWILNYLKMNATEKLQMVAILRAAIGEPWNDDLDFDHWNELVVKFWLQGVKKVEHVSEPEPPQPVLISQESHHGIGTHTLTADQIYRDNSGTLSQQYRRPPPSQSPRPYNIPNLAVDILVPRVQSDIRPVGNYGLLDLEEDDEFKLRSDQGHPPQPEPCFPILQVTTPNDNPVIASGATEDSNRLAPCNNFRSRNDSAHDSEVEKEQCLRGSVHDSMHDHNSSRANDKSVLGMLESRSEVEVLNVHFDELKTAGVDYSGWVWSPSLRLYYSNGFGDDDEIIESLWLDCRDSGDDSNPCHFPQEEIASDIDFHVFTTGAYDPLYAPSSDTSRRNSDVGDYHDSHTMSQIYEFERIGRIRSWQSSPFPPYLNNVRDTPIWQDKHYTSIDPAKHDSFFTSGRIFEVLWSRIRQNSLGRLSQSSRNSSPGRRGRDGAWSGSAQFVVILNKGSSSLCAPITSSSLLNFVNPFQSREDFGRIDTPGQLLRPRSNDILGKQPLRVLLQEETVNLLPSDARINYADIHEIPHDIRLIEIGSVEEQHREWLLRHFRESNTRTHQSQWI